MTPTWDFTLFLGRFHPLLVHLPIGLMVLLVFLDLLSRWPRFRSANDGAGYVLALAAPAAIASAVCGWLLARSGGYDADLLRWHQWLGISTAVLCGVLAVLRLLALRRAYAVGLYATAIVLAAASHFGGSLTHGSNYLVEHAPAPLRALLGGTLGSAARPPGDPGAGQAGIFAAAIQPALSRYCAECHQAEKQKGKLRLDTLEGILRGGGDGPALVRGNADQSLLLKRLLLPLDDEEHMPPSGKPQPGPELVTVLRWWINAGAPAEGTAASLGVPPEIQRLIEAGTGAVKP